MSDPSKLPADAGRKPTQKRAASGRTALVLVLLGLGAVILFLGGSLIAAAFIAVMRFDFDGAPAVPNKDEHAAVDPAKDMKPAVPNKDDHAATKDKKPPDIPKDQPVVPPANDFVPLFNGNDLAGWKSLLKGGGADDGRVFTVHDGILTISGQPHGYLYTEASYRNYLIRLDWRYERPKKPTNDRSFQGDSGLLLHMTGEPKVWPDSVQVQWYHQEYGLIYLVPHIQNKNYIWNRSAVEKAMHRVGEWNRTEVLSQDGRITCTLNGIEVCVGNGKLFAGQIGLQSEGAMLHFKRIDIKQLP